MSLFFLHLPWFNLCICLSVSHLTEPFFLSQLLLSHYIDLSKSRNTILLFWTHHCKRYYHAWVHEGVICFLTPFSLKYWPFPEQVPRTPCWTCSCPQELQLTLQSSVPKSLSCKMFPCRLMRLAVLLSHRTTAHNLVTFLLYLWHILLMSERLHIVRLRPPVFQTELTKKLRNVCWVKKVIIHLWMNCCSMHRCTEQSGNTRRVTISQSDHESASSDSMQLEGGDKRHLSGCVSVSTPKWERLQMD